MAGVRARLGLWVGSSGAGPSHSRIAGLWSQPVTSPSKPPMTRSVTLVGGVVPDDIAPIGGMGLDASLLVHAAHAQFNTLGEPPLPPGARGSGCTSRSDGPPAGRLSLFR